MPDLKGQTLLLLEDGHCLRDQALEVCSRVDVHEAEDFRATSLETLRQMVVAGLGITLLPELAVESPFGSQRGLTIREFRQARADAHGRRGVAQIDHSCIRHFLRSATYWQTPYH